MNSDDVWLQQSRMSEPGRHAAAVDALPDRVAELNAVVQGLLVHSDWLADYGLDDSLRTTASRTTLPVAARLDILDDGDRLDRRRPPDRRSLGTCRDFALLLCAFLRGKGVPARLRCGFAAYLDHFAAHSGGAWEDHWVCEYRDPESGLWRLSDAQLDAVMGRKFAIAFDPADVPRQAFVTAGQAWLDCRSGRADPARFGHGTTSGLWFVSVNVLRDHYALNGRETSDWDGWRSAAPDAGALAADASLLDRIATDPAQPIIAVDPGWA